MHLPLSIAYGTTYTTDAEAYEYTSRALEAGYRIINTCAAYGNVRGMGRAIAHIPREDLIVVFLDSNTRRSSIYPERFDGYKAELTQIYESLENLSLSYIDYFLINWPVPRYMENVWPELNADTWRAMEDCRNKGIIKHIGVSNFLPYHLVRLRETATLPVEVNQLEIHPSFPQRETVRFCQDAGINVMAWSPLFKGSSTQLPVITELADKYGKSPAQLILRWNIQRGIVPVVCSTNESHMRSNLDVFQFEISQRDMYIIDNLENGEHVSAYSYERQRASVEGKL